jgi:ubiquitin carboxyl-terminal hydrolase 22/27/51
MERGGHMDRFTQPENIAVKDWTCQKCGKVSQEANKRLSIKRLPPVLSIQFKVSSSFPFITNEF